MANYTLSPSPFQKFFLADGVTPAANGRVYTYLAGLTTPATTYTDAAGLIPNSNPIHLDGAGQCAIFLAPGSYGYAVYAAPLVAGMDQSGGLIETQDNISAVAAPATTATFTTSGIAGETLTDGQLCYLSDGSGGKTAGRWYLAKADNGYSSITPTLAFSFGGAIINTTGIFTLGGQVTSGVVVTVGLFYYVSSTVAGGLTSTVPTNARLVGFADSGTSLQAFPNPPTPYFAEWTTPTFNAAIFTGNGGMTWTLTSGDVTTFEYRLLGKSMVLNFYLSSTSCSGGQTQLIFTIPASKVAAKAVRTSFVHNDNAAASAIGTLEINAGGTTVILSKLAGNWAAAADTTSVTGSVEFEIQ